MKRKMEEVDFSDTDEEALCNVAEAMEKAHYQEHFKACKICNNLKQCDI